MSNNKNNILQIKKMIYSVFDNFILYNFSIKNNLYIGIKFFILLKKYQLLDNINIII